MSCESPENPYILKCFNFVWLGGISNVKLTLILPIHYFIKIIITAIGT